MLKTMLLLRNSDIYTSLQIGARANLRTEYVRRATIIELDQRASRSLNRGVSPLMNTSAHGQIPSALANWLV